MIYKKNSEKTLSAELFANPTSEYRAAPFWAWNCKLEKDMLCRQIEDFKKMGFGGFHMHSRTGLETEYLSDEFMDMVKTCCDKAESEDMLAWLYDEDRWSSGPAGGLVTKHKEFRRKRLKMYSEDKGWYMPKTEALKAGEPYLLACYDVIIDSDGFLKTYSRINASDNAKGVKWYAYCVNEKESPWFNGNTYFDAMNKEAAQEFVKITHERYKEVIGDRFDKSVPAIFTDEPNADHEKAVTIPTPDYTGEIKRAWSRFFEEEYIKEYGCDILDVLPELIWNKKDSSDSLTKYRYFNLKAKLFQQNFSKTLGDWCGENGISLTGHMLREPELSKQTITCGEVMRNYGDYQLPGIDILCNLREFTTAKQAQSATHQYGKEGVMSELYGVTNWDFDFRGHKLQGDWQAALGITVRVPHLAWLSMKGEAKRDYPASIGYQSPWYKEYPYIENHFARLATALSRGKAIVKIGVIHPVESTWISMGPNSQCATRISALENNFNNVTDYLLQSHLDFDFICESTIPELADSNDTSKIGQMKYDAIVVPGCLTLRKTTVEFLNSFKGKIIFMGECPTYIDGVKSDYCTDLYNHSHIVNFDKAALSEALDEVRNINIRNSAGIEDSSYIYNYRQDGDCRWLFIARSEDVGNHPHNYGQYQRDVLSGDNYTVTVKGEFIPCEYDTISGDIKPIDYEHKNGCTVIHKKLYDLDSLLINLSDKEFTFEDKTDETSLVNEFDIKTTVDYSLSEPNVLLLDRAEYAFDGGAWQPEDELLRVSTKFRNHLGFRSEQTQPYALDPSPAKNVAHLRFTFESEVDVVGALLAIEDADIVTLRLNGADVKKEITGYFTDESIMTLKLPEIVKGNNILEIDLPFSERTNIEWCYILGDFGVKVMGCTTKIVQKPEKIGFSDMVSQGFPFYSANVTYNFDVEMESDGELEIHTSYYRGALVAVSVDGERKGSIVLPPYNLNIKDVSKGKHTVSLTLFGNRHNSFGALHLVNEGEKWFGPDAWRTVGDDWCYEYKLRPLGILKSPVIKTYKK